MRRRTVTSFALCTAAALGAARGAAADEIVVLEGLGSGLLVRSDGPRIPNSIVGRPVTGLEEDETIQAIDTRPGNRVLYGVTAKRIYAIDLASGAATPLGPRFEQDLGMNSFRPIGFDIDPVADVVRYMRPVTGPGAMGPFLGMSVVEIDPDTGRLAGTSPIDFGPKAFAYVAGDPAFGSLPRFGGLAYSGARAPDLGSPASWTGFGIDTDRGTLVRIGSAGGLLSPTDDRLAVTTIAPISGLPSGAKPFSLEIGSDGAAYTLARDLGGFTMHEGLYQLDLVTGAATLMWDMGQGAALDLAVLSSAMVPEVQPLDVTRAVVRLDFRRNHRGNDSVEITGTVPTPADGVQGKSVQVDLDGVVRTFVLDARGRGVSGQDSFRITTKRGAVKSRYSLVVRKPQLDVAGIWSRTPSGPVKLVVHLFVDRASRRATLDLDYVLRGRRGVASLARN